MLKSKLTKPSKRCILALSLEKEQYVGTGIICTVEQSPPCVGIRNKPSKRSLSAQERLPQEHHLLHARGFFSLGLAYELSGQTALAVQNYLKSSEEAQSAGVLFLAIHALGAAAQVQISQGQLHMAEQACQQAMQIAGGNACLHWVWQSLFWAASLSNETISPLPRNSCKMALCYPVEAA